MPHAKVEGRRHYVKVATFFDGDRFKRRTELLLTYSSNDDNLPPIWYRDTRGKDQSLHIKGSVSSHSLNDDV